MYTGKVAVILSAAETMQLILLLNTASGDCAVMVKQRMRETL